MATYKEEKKKRPDDYVAQTYAPPTPTARYAGSDSERMYNAIIQRYAEAADPQRQAEQDARIQRGRKFWTGANLFANVIANAINANGTAKGAPNMTWNDAPSQKMYDVWRDADKQLRADRKEAQQRYEAMALQDANMRLADQQAADKEALNTYNMNFNLQNDAAKANWNRELKEYDMQEARQQKLEDEERANKEWERRNDIQYKQNERLARIRHSGSGGGSKGSGDYSISLGSINIPAKDKKEAEKISKDIANKIVDRYNKGVEERNAEKRKNNKFIDEKELEKPLAKPKNNKESEGIIYQLGDMYDDDTDFRKDINSTYGIEDIYNEPEPVVATQPQYQMPTYQPSWASPSTPSQPVPSASATSTASSASASGASGQTSTPYRNDGYFLGSRQQPDNRNVPIGSNRYNYRDGIGISRLKVEGNNADWNISGTPRAPHELTEEEKKLIKKNGEKPKINY